MSEVPSVTPVFRVTYARFADVRADTTTQLARGGLLVRVPTVDTLVPGDRVTLTLVLPHGQHLSCDSEILNVLPGHGIAVRTPPSWVNDIRKAIAWKLDEASAEAPPHHEMILERAPVVAAPPVRDAVAEVAVQSAPREYPSDEPVKLEALSNAEKLHLALHGNRDERNAILRDKNRQLHLFVLRNPQITLEDVVAMAKNTQLSPELLKQIGERSEWMQRATVALALARNPKTPPDVAVRALGYVPKDALRQMAKGVGALPHVVQAARKRVIAG